MYAQHTDKMHTHAVPDLITELHTGQLQHAGSRVGVDMILRKPQKTWGKFSSKKSPKSLQANPSKVKGLNQEASRAEAEVVRSAGEPIPDRAAKQEPLHPPWIHYWDRR